MYFGANSLEDFSKVFTTIIARCDTADLKLKPGKLRLKIQEADILGLNWNRGRLSPSRHKLDPLAECQPPTTVSGLRSWLGSVRFNEVCLPGAKLAELTKPLDEQIPASRSGKETVTWSAELLDPFKRIQQILKAPMSVVIPKRGDTTFLAVDACTSLPAGGSKLFVQRPETKTSVVFVMPVGCRPLEIPALALKSVLKPQSLPALYQTKPPNAGIMLTSVT